LIDTNVWIDALAGRLSADSFLRLTLQADWVGYSAITRLELFGFPGLTSGEEQKMSALLKNFSEVTRKSDLDLMIGKDTAKRFFDRYKEFDGIHDLIKDRAVDMLIYTPEELKKISHRPFVRKMLEEGITIYEH